MQQINYTCFANRSGYAQAAQDYIYALREQNKYEIKISLLHSSPEQLSLTPERYKEYLAMMRVPEQTDAIQILHCVPDTQKRTIRGRKTVGFATFETYDPPQDWVNILNTNDIVICPSLFNVAIFAHAGVKKPIQYIPHCIDTNVFNPIVSGTYRKNDKFTFLYFGTWKKRKGWDILLDAWMREFDANDNVQLLIKTDRFTIANQAVETVKKEWQGKKELAPILFEGRVLNDEELPRFLKSVDCLVAPTAGEGFGLPGLQCMALGVPVIITNFSGCTDYANESTATLIEPEKFVVYNDMDGIAQFKSKKWANVTVDRVRNAMRYVIENKEKVKQKTEIARAYVNERFSYPVVASKFSKLVDSLI